MTTQCLVVIGHVDHGKTALVRALTGIETDRTAQEKERGLSILPGFAHKHYARGIIDFIDAPGHEDFIVAMISGATGAQGALIVISASEGVRAQTLEHLTIARLLGLTRVIIAVTKSDSIPASQHDPVLDALRTALIPTGFDSAPMVLCSAQTGAGLKDLEQALETVLIEDAPSPRTTAALLPIDRVFTRDGHGTIVTGTLLGATLSRDDDMILQPAQRAVSIKALHSRGNVRATVQPGERVAVNLRGIAVDAVARGDVLASPNAGAASTCMDVSVTLHHTLRAPLKHMQQVRVLFGTTAAIATLRLFGGGTVAQGAQAMAQLRFAKPVFGYAGQRAILRRLSPEETLGMAEFLDPAATPARAGDTRRLHLLEAVRTGKVPQIAASLISAHHGIAKVTTIARLARSSTAGTRSALGTTVTEIAPDWIAENNTIDAHKARLIQSLTAYHATHPRKIRAPRNAVIDAKLPLLLAAHIEAALVADTLITPHEAGLALRTHDPAALLPPEDQARMTELCACYKSGAISPPAPFTAPLDVDLIALLVEAGTLVSLPNVALKQTVIFHKDALAEAAQILASAFPPPQGFTTSQARTALATSRKYIVPVLEHFDRTGITRRSGDLRHMTALAVPTLHSAC